MQLVRVVTPARSSHATARKRATFQTVAAIDLGSNSFHMIVARVLNGQLHVLDRLQEMVQLAAGLDERNRLDKAAQRRALGCLERFQQRLHGMTAGSVRVVATDALRRARNPGKFLAAAERALGRPIEVISGQEEARLIYQGVARNLPEEAERRLVIDIGGGSTEFIIGQGLEPLRMNSLHIGCIGVNRRWFPDGVIKKRAFERATTAAALELQNIATQFRALGWRRAIGSSGTVRAIAAVSREQGWSAGEITSEALRNLCDRMLVAGHVDRLKLSGLSAERAPLLPGGVAILMAAFEALGIERLEVSDYALRDGLLYDLMRRLSRHDVRGRTISVWSARYHVDVAQALRVERTVKRLLKQARSTWVIDDEAARALGWAARLHEIGLAIAHTKYHKHGAYLVEHSELPGFSYPEQRLLAVLIRGHRRRFPVEVFGDLPRAVKPQARRACVLLRFAVLLHRARTDVELPALRIEARNNTLRIKFPRGWLTRHPLTHADLAQEASYLRVSGFILKYR